MYHRLGPAPQRVIVVDSGFRPHRSNIDSGVPWAEPLTEDDIDTSADFKKESADGPADRRIFYERAMAITVGPGQNQPGVELMNPSDSNVNIGIMRIEIILTQVLDTSLALIYLDRTTMGQLSAAAVRGLDVLTQTGGNVSTPSSRAQLDTAWAVTPTVNTSHIRRQRCSALGETVVWAWDPTQDGLKLSGNGPPLALPPGSAIAIVEPNVAPSGTYLVNFRWMEEPLGLGR